MKKYVHFLFALFSVCILSTQALAADLAVRVQRAALAPIPPAQTNPLQKLLAAASCLHQGREKCTVISWTEAEALMQQAHQEASARHAMLENYQNLRSALPIATRQRELPFNISNEEDVFKKASQYKFIFIGENHLPGIVPAVVRALQTIRHEHPQARILFASEFVTTFAPLHAVPFQKAGTQNPHFQQPSATYSSVLQAAEQLNMDVLSLEDAWIEGPVNGFAKWRYPTKVGNYLVDADETTPQIAALVQRAMQKDPTNGPLAVIKNLHDSLLSTAWGVAQRNKQWTNYIAALQQNYEYVIVYGGKGHFLPTGSTTPVPQLLGLKQYALIDLAKVPTAQEQFWLDQVNQQRHPAAGKVELENTPGIIYQGSRRIQDRQPQQRQYAAQLSQLQRLEKNLGFAKETPFEVKITLPK